ncbi:putative Endoplasmic reticulum-based factor for assembly of V-ATPase-domain-containing protein [Seiridium cardinale]|uniref:Endoplasmic reticulum-based factor for assembly of V-ATPase-domain-containing protein n=1 Tax=Seiridium cardinale TaxID=138064 RepID=A0ABR2XHV7_9PEZI
MARKVSAAQQPGSSGATKLPVVAASWGYKRPDGRSLCLWRNLGSGPNSRRSLVQLTDGSCELGGARGAVPVAGEQSSFGEETVASLREIRIITQSTLKRYFPLVHEYYIGAAGNTIDTMVLLTMTASIVEALKDVDELSSAAVPELSSDENRSTNEPNLADSTVGDPISHAQIIDLWKRLRAQNRTKHSLEELLRGATIYIPPPPPKAEPSDEYKQLMARLRRDEEERSYERMVRAPPTRETFTQRFPTAPMTMADSFAEANKPSRKSDLGEDIISHGEVQKQVTLIVNFLVSIAGCAAAFWICAQWWSTTARLFLTLFGTIVVAVCEVAVYSAYSWRMEEGDRKQRNMKEVKEIVTTWVIGDDSGKKEGYEPVLIQPKDHDADMGLRKRTNAPT